MQNAVHVVSTLYATLAVFPFLTFMGIWFLVYLLLKDKKKSTRLAMDLTAFFLVGSVSTIWNQLFHSTFGFWFIVLIMLIGFGLIGGYQHELKGTTDLLKVGRIIWRVGFLVLIAVYFILLIMYIGTYFMKSSSL